MGVGLVSATIIWTHTLKLNVDPEASGWMRLEGGSCDLLHIIECYLPSNFRQPQNKKRNLGDKAFRSKISPQLSHQAGANSCRTPSSSVQREKGESSVSCKHSLCGSLYRGAYATGP